MNKNKKLITAVIWIALLGIVVYLVMTAGGASEPNVLTFTQFVETLEQGKVKAVKQVLNEGVVYGLYTDSDYEMKDLPKRAQFTLVISEEEFSRNMAAIVSAKDPGKTADSVTSVDYGFAFEQVLPQGESWLLVIIPYLIIGGIMVFLFVMIMRQQSGGGKQIMNFGKSRARLHGKGDVAVTFKDVAGAQEEKEELSEIVDFLKDPKRYHDLGARIPKGVLLVGPPGTGKTLLAKAVAGEAKVPFYFISGSDFVEMYVGVGASRVRDLFETAKRTSPSIVFIDEIDAVGRQRGAGLGGGHDEREQTLNQLLVEMDGFTTNDNVIILAATNRADILDPALMRPGRFDRKVVMNYPDVKGREEILKVHARNKHFAADVDFSILAKRTGGFTGADLENVLNEAALLTARERKQEITMSTLEEATIRVQMGPEKRSRVVTPEDRKLTAYHEAGHAILALKLEKADKLHEISIISRGNAAGYTLFLPDDIQHMTERRMLDGICMSLGGRVAEKLKFGDVSTGAVQDLKQSSEIARRMVEEFGMSDIIGPVFLGGDTEVFIAKDWGHGKNYSEHVASQIDGEVRRIMEEQYERALDLLTRNMAGLDRTAELLLELEHVSGEEFEAVFNEAMGISAEVKRTAETAVQGTDAEEQNRQAEESTDTENE